MSRLPTTLTIKFENHKADKDLGGNSRAHYRTIRAKNKANKNVSYILTLSALQDAGTDAGEFLTNGYIYLIPQALPLVVICRRFYTGMAKAWDTDNLSGCFKGYLDGLADVLGVNDKSFSPRYEQFRSEDYSSLEIEVIPNWNLVGATA